MIEWWWQRRRWRRRLNCCDSDCLDGATMIWWLYNDSDDDDDTRMIGWLYEWLLRCSDEPFHIFKLMYQLIVVFAVGAVVGWRWRYNDDLIVAWWWSYMMRWWQRRDCCDDCIGALLYCELQFAWLGQRRWPKDRPTTITITMRHAPCARYTIIPLRYPLERYH